MGAYVLRRLLQAVPVLLLASIAIFLMLRLIPGDPAIVILGPDAQPEQIAAIREQLHLNDALPLQYLAWLGQVSGRPRLLVPHALSVSDLIIGKLPPRSS
jgi:peptide/nickel transport system permease protein